MAKIAFLECTRCGEHLEPNQPQTICPRDGGVLFARYNLESIKKSFKRESLAGRIPSMWRYHEVLPEAEPVSLGEGFTPLLRSREYP
ncbi:MAG TPA: threonine synthase, partial [Terriglobales bacterium]|nr:threonine synthase [Terriglobales bacterium]